MINKRRYSIKAGGESGQGINVTGEILAKGLKNAGYKVFAYREYPSLIQGGCASYQIDFSCCSISSSSKNCDILICVSCNAVYNYLWDLNRNGILLHTIKSLEFNSKETEFIKKNKIKIHFTDAFSVAEEIGGNKLMSNVFFSGAVWKILGLEYSIVQSVIEAQFKSKPELLRKDLNVLFAGYELFDLPLFKYSLNRDLKNKDSYLISGNEAVALGALKAGMRAYYSYPMTPATSIHKYLSGTYKKTGILIKEAEDEITAVQLAIGSMYAGARAMVATSGGGFDLMSESLSFAGMAEIPLVVGLVQRCGAATGLPTWTGQADLNIAVNSGHGEFPRVVIASADAESAYSLVQKAFDYAERFQTAVIFMSEKQIAESLFNLVSFPKPLKIKRYLLDNNSLKKVRSEDRYKITSNGISPRWLPGDIDADYLTNSDDHLGDGSSTEDSQSATDMIQKRMRKIESIIKSLPVPKLYGPVRADISFVGWGSTKNTILDVMNILRNNKTGKTINYLHYDFVYPLNRDYFNEFIKKTKKAILIEGNYEGQFGKIICQFTGYDFKYKLLKYDGRPFFIEDILSYI